MGRPDIVGKAVILLYVHLGIMALRNIGAAMQEGGFTATAVYVGEALPEFVYQANRLLVLCLMWLLIRKIGKGKNWARITYLGLFTITLPFVVFFTQQYAMEDLIWGANNIVQLVITAIGLLMLFQKPSSEWFRAMKRTE